MAGSDATPALAQDILTLVLSDRDMAGAFLDQSGLAVGNLRARASDPELLAAALDFVLAEDARVLAAARALGVSPAVIVALRAALPGGDTPDWT